MNINSIIYHLLDLVEFYNDCCGACNWPRAITRGCGRDRSGIENGPKERGNRGPGDSSEKIV